MDECNFIFRENFYDAYPLNINYHLMLHNTSVYRKYYDIAKINVLINTNFNAFQQEDMD